jgi:hypothetical protein
MPAAMRRRIGDALLFTSGVAIVAFVIVVSDHRVRERVSLLMGSGRPMAGLTDVGSRLGEFVQVAAHLARGFGHDQSLLAIFAVGAMVLFAAILRL